MSPVHLSAAQWRLLGEGFRGPRPGSNALTLLGLTDGTATVSGAEIEALIRAGLLTFRPVHGDVAVLPAGVGAEDETVDVEMTHNYELSPAGHRLRAEQEKP
jgi:hypothetical protein